MFIVYRRPFKDGEPSTVYEFEHGEAHGPFETYDQALEYANNLPYWKVITWGFAPNEPTVVENPDGHRIEYDTMPDLEELKWMGDYEIKPLVRF